ncbi:MAG: undecaprenyl/decaprenyl-phosphate alpha-N-acetylglucosaminyl 1-phosphate transferase, partial [Candidatus Aminicenantes bacterium]
MSEAFIYLSAFIVSLFISLGISTPVSIWIASRIGAIDHPGDLTIHEYPIPRLGGLGIFISWIITISIFMIIFSIYDPRILIILLGILFIIIIGIIDDIRGIKQTRKFIIYFLLSLTISWLIIDIKSWWILASASIFIVGMINAYNFIDGMDGLASGLAIINYFALFILFIFDGSLLLAFISISYAGACSGFLPYNWHRARIFLGDVGSLSIGLSIAGLSVIFLENGSWDFNRAIAVLFIAAIPIG